ncbi:MAG: hypothetical protein V1738_06675 [Patescibacteria group bacterium]
MRQMIAFLFVLCLGCGCAATQAPTVEAPAAVQPSVFTSECLEVTAPPGWQLAKAETIRPTPEDINAGQAYGTFSGMLLQRDQTHDITILHPHGDSEMADAMFATTFVSLAVQARAVQANPEAAAADGIVSMTVTPPIEMTGVSEAYLYTAAMEETNGNVVRGWFLLLPLDPADDASYIVVNTNVPPADGEEYSSEVLDIVRTLRFLCAEAPD